jgi:hypothetical protein
MKFICRWFPLIIAAGVFFGVVAAVKLPTARVSVVVREPDGATVPAANVGIGGTLAGGPGESAKGVTSVDGRFTAEVQSNGEVGITVRKDGFYDTLGETLNFRDVKGATERAFATGRWEPWDKPIDVVLKRKLHPTALFARRIETKLPSELQPMGFDLLKGDWVAPHGGGESADLFFEVSRTIQSDRDYVATLTLSFPNKGDGVIPFQAPPHRGSVLKSTQMAPTEGYQNGKSWTKSRSPSAASSGDYTQSTEREDQHYLLRVRTTLDSNGRIQNALYGKIYGDIHLYTGTRAPKAGIGFTYYLNPTPNDRNLEFDPKHNLFTDLKADEQVTEP